MKITAEIHKVFGFGIAGSWGDYSGIAIIIGPLLVVIEFGWVNP